MSEKGSEGDVEEAACASPLFNDATERTETTTYGSINSNSSKTNDIEEQLEMEEEAEADEESAAMLDAYQQQRKYSRCPSNILPTTNVMLSVRSPLLPVGRQQQPSTTTISPSFFFDDHRVVQSELCENTHLVVDPTLEPNEAGRLYLSEESYYNSRVQPQYVLTAHPSLYADTLLKELHDSHRLPCGMYWCCHETGAATADHDHDHDDHSSLVEEEEEEPETSSSTVDIRIAWGLASVFLTVLLCLG